VTHVQVQLRAAIQCDAGMRWRCCGAWISRAEVMPARGGAWAAGLSGKWRVRARPDVSGGVFCTETPI
jgi:hypothetical protein